MEDLLIYILPLLMFVVLLLLLMLGYPVAFTLGAVTLSGLGAADTFEFSFLQDAQ